MDNKRQVNWKVFYELLKERKPFSFLGIIFTAVSLFVILPLLLTLTSALKKPYEKYDFDAIQKNGTEKTAKITYIGSMNNVTVNDEHPEIISYEFEDNGKVVSDKFATFDLEKVANFSVGGTAQVLSYNNQSVIKNLKPFSFPFGLFFILPGVFLTLGVIFLLVGLLPAFKKFNLYKTGRVEDAYLISIVSNTAGQMRNRWQQNFLVNYYFLDGFGSKVLGKSVTTDLLMVNEKKAGDKVKIFVDESDNNNSCLVPGLEAMKYNWSI